MKRKLILYSAMSLDGYIARENGSIDWLENHENPTKTDYGYKDFYSTIDTTIMGRLTYDQIVSFGETNIYKGKTNYVISHSKQGSVDTITYINEDLVTFVKKLKEQEGKDIWLVGGGQINSVLFEAGLVDKIHLHIFPIMLNKGIPLCSCGLSEINFNLVNIKTYESGVLEVEYLVK